MIKNFLLVIICLTPFISVAQNVNIPDANFKACLVANAGLNTNGDSEIQVTEAANYSATLSCTNLGITDITGIEAFTSLSNALNLTSNQISNVDLTNSPALQFFTCDGCGIDTINLTGLTSLKFVFVPFSNFTTFDASVLPSLESLYIMSGPLASITFGSANTNLEILNLSETNITSLDITSLSALQDLSLQLLDINQIDLSNNINLIALQLFQAELQSLDVSNNLALESLRFIQASELTSLDLSQNTALVDLRVPFSPLLSSLTLASGNNSAITTLNTDGCSALFCVEVDNTIDILNPPSGWNLGSGTSLSYDCTAIIPSINIPDANFKACLLANTAINTNGDTEIQLNEANSFTGNVDCVNQGIADLTGIEEFINAQFMFFSDNLITSFTGPVNTSLVDLRLSRNVLTQIDLSANTSLVSLYVDDNNLTSLNTAGLADLNSIRGTDNNISSLDLTDNTNLVVLTFRNNLFTTFQTDNLPLLESLTLTNNPLTEIDISSNVALRNLRIDETSVSTLDISNTLNLDTLVISETQISQLDATLNVTLEVFGASSSSMSNLLLPPVNAMMRELYINDTQIPEIDTTALLELETISIRDTQITFLDLSENNNLIEFFGRNGNLTGVRIDNGNNLNLVVMEVNNNDDLECIQVDGDIDINNPPSDWEKDDTAMYSYDCDFLGTTTFQESQVSIFPNPTNDVITISSEMPIKEIKLYNVQGALITEGNINIISLGNFPSGVYFLKITSNTNSVITKRIIKE